MEVLKEQYNKGKSDNLFFWRNNSGHEIDVIIDKGIELLPVEIKVGHTISKEYFKGVEYWNKLSGNRGGYVVYAGDDYQKRSNGIEIIPYTRIFEYIKN